MLIVSDWGPPMIDGPSIILGNLLREFRENEAILFSRKINKNNSIYNKKGNALDIKRYSVYVPSLYIPELSSFLRRLFRLIETAWIPFTVIKGVIIVLAEKVDYILATSDAPHAHFLTAAYCIARIMRKKLVLYFFDPVEEFRMGRIQKVLVKRLMPRLVKYASKFIVMSNTLADHYRVKYGIKCEVLPHSVRINGSEDATVPEDGLMNEETEIIFSGKISKYQEDSLLNLKKAIDLIPQKIRLKIYTSTKPNYLRMLGFSGAHIATGHLDHEHLMEELKKADILFLPLSFQNSGSSVVKAAFPAKTMDYLLAKRPILIHAPKDSFIVNYAKKNGFAVCVTENGTNSLANAIQNLIENKNLSVELIKNCQKTFLQHSSRIVYKKFVKIMGEI